MTDADGREPAAGAEELDEQVGLAEAAARLGVHYMTVYRYVRLGRLAAQLRGGRWTVRASDLDRLAGAPRSAAGRTHSNWSRRREHLIDRMTAGDGPGSWALIEHALAGGASPTEIYLELLGPSLRSIGDRWASGSATIEQEHLATAVAVRLLGRIGPRFARPGRPRRGTVVIGAAAGDHHLLPVVMVSDVLRGAGLRVVDLGADVPEGTFLEAVARSARPVTVGVSVSVDASAAAAADAMASLRRAYPDAVVLAGGPALRTKTDALELGAHDWAPDAAGLADRLCR
jgi:excisionase family DNA binding protein